MCAKVISISYTCWATYNNQKTTPGQEVHKFYQFQALFLAYWGFQNTRLKWQILPLVWVVQRQNSFSFRGLRPLNPWPGAPPQTLVIGSRPALAMSLTRAFCPPHCFRPGDARVAFSTTSTVLFRSSCLALFADLTLVILSYLGSDRRSGASTNLSVFSPTRLCRYRTLSNNKTSTKYRKLTNQIYRKLILYTNTHRSPISLN